MPPKDLSNIHYIITIAGLYYTAKQKGDNMHPYEIDVPMTHAQIEDKDESPLSLWRRLYAPRMMPINYPDFEGLASV